MPWLNPVRMFLDLQHFIRGHLLRICHHIRNIELSLNWYMLNGCSIISIVNFTNMFGHSLFELVKPYLNPKTTTLLHEYVNFSPYKIKFEIVNNTLHILSDHKENGPYLNFKDIYKQVCSCSCSGLCSNWKHLRSKDLLAELYRRHICDTKRTHWTLKTTHCDKKTRRTFNTTHLWQKSYLFLILKCI